MVDFTLTQLAHFVAASETLSMTDAAHRLRVAQSSISASIAALEKALGVQLFVRHPAKGLSITPEGVETLQHARQLLADAEELKGLSSRAAETVSGVVRVACFVTIGPWYLPRILARTHELHPELRVVASEADYDEQLEMLQRGTVDAVLSYDLGLSHTLHCEHVAWARPYVVVAHDHPLARRRAVLLAELAGEKLVLLDRPYSRDYIRHTLEVAGLDLEVEHVGQSVETVRATVGLGRGIAILNQHPGHELVYGGGRVASVPILDAVDSPEVVLARLPHTRETPRLAALTAIVQQIGRELSQTQIAVNE